MAKIRAAVICVVIFSIGLCCGLLVSRARNSMHNNGYNFTQAYFDFQKVCWRHGRFIGYELVDETGMGKLTRFNCEIKILGETEVILSVEMMIDPSGHLEWWRPPELNASDYLIPTPFDLNSPSDFERTEIARSQREFGVALESQRNQREKNIE